MAKRRIKQSRVSDTDNDAPVYRLAARFQDSIHIPDPDQLFATVGCLAGNCIAGDPVWLLLVGPSSCGKTTMVNAMSAVPGTRTVLKLKNEAGLLSASPKKDRAADATGGILSEIGERGCLLFSDYTSILSLPREPMRELLGAFREIYDGHWGRTVGAEGGREIHWRGKVGLIGGSTPAIDRYQLAISELGDRTIFFRYPVSEGYREALTSLNVDDREEAAEGRAEAVREMLDECGLSLSSPAPRRKMTLQERDGIVAAAQFCARARTAVKRTTDMKREIEDVPTPEVPTRLTNQLGQFFLGAEAVGLHTDDIWRVVGRFALDSIPLMRRVTLETILRFSKTGEAHTPAVARAVPASTQTVERTIEDLALLGVIEREGGRKKGEGAGQWGVSAWVKERMEFCGMEKTMLEKGVMG